MALYGRSDVVSVAVPVNSGGCGVIHSRPVADGVALEEWDLERECARCAVTLKGDPLWSATVAEIPETPDERLIREDAEKRGERAIKKAQEQLSVRQHELTEKIVQLLEQNGTARPGTGTADVQVDIAEIVQREIAKAIAQSRLPDQVAGTVEAPVEVNLDRLHVRTLGKMCRERGLDDKGGKADLIARLTA